MLNFKTIGSIVFNEQDVLGNGFSSTVYKGKFGIRNVAVKKVDNENFKLMEKEINLLQKSDEHLNIIRYFHTEKDERFSYIAVELCLCTLKDYVGDRIINSRISVQEIAKQFFSGMRFLHSLSIVHRDIKPTNVLLKDFFDGRLIVKISDFGFAKELQNSSSEMSVVVRGSRYWTIPEMQQSRYNSKSDVYAGGRILHYLAMNGKIDEKFSWENSKEKSKIYLIMHLVMMMTRENFEDRPPFHCLLHHPFFWDSQKTLNFFFAVENRLKRVSCSDDICLNALKEVNDKSKLIFGESWIRNLEEDMKKSLDYRGNPNKVYNESITSDLIRAICNMHSHFNELSQETQQILGSIPHKFVKYWTKKFPRLLTAVYLSIHRSGLYKDGVFGEFYQRCHG
jgi:serine/threonine protein kinase